MAKWKILAVAGMCLALSVLVVVGVRQAARDSGPPPLGQASGWHVGQPFEAPYDLRDLEAALTDPDWAIRTRAARSLGLADEIDVRLRLSVLLDALEEECERPLSHEIPQEACGPITEGLKADYALAVKELGDAVVPLIRERYAQAEGEFKARLLVILGSLGDKTTTNDLLDVLSDAEDAYLRAQTIRALENLGPTPEIVAALVEALEDEFWVISNTDLDFPDPEYKKMYVVRARAFTALSHFGIKVQRKGVADFSVDEEELKAWQAAIPTNTGKLFRQQIAAVNAIVAESVTSSDAYLPSKRYGRLDLHRLYELLHEGEDLSGSQRVDILVRWLAYERANPSPPTTGFAGGRIDSSYIQVQIVKMLREKGDASAMTELVESEAISDEGVRDALICALGMMGDASRIPRLLEILETHKEGDFRALAAEALGDLGAAEAAEALNRAQTDGFAVQAGGDVGPVRLWVAYPVREAAAGALQRLNREEHRARAQQRREAFAESMNRGPAESTAADGN